MKLLKMNQNRKRREKTISLLKEILRQVVPIFKSCHTYRQPTLQLTLFHMQL